MHEVYLWKAERGCPNRLSGWYDSDNSPRSVIFSEGRHVEKNEFIGLFDKKFHEYPVIRFDKTSGEALDHRDYLTASPAPIVSERLKAFIEKLAPNDVEFFEVKVFCTDGEMKGYYLLNVIQEVRGIDFEKSDYDKIDMAKGAFRYHFRYMTYKPNCMKEHQFARDADYHGNLLVREDAAKAIMDGKFKGVYLVRPENFYRPITIDDLTGGEPDE